MGECRGSSRQFLESGHPGACGGKHEFPSSVLGIVCADTANAPDGVLWQAALPADQRKVAGRLEFRSSRRRSRLYDELAFVQTLYTTYCYQLSTEKLNLKEIFLNALLFVRFCFIDNHLDIY